MQSGQGGTWMTGGVVVPGIGQVIVVGCVVVVSPTSMPARTLPPKKMLRRLVRKVLSNVNVMPSASTYIVPTVGFRGSRGSYAE